MKAFTTFTCAAAAVLALAAPGRPNDVDGGNDCQHETNDFGDAPEDVPAYGGAILGHFPTCIAPSAMGTQEIDSPCVSSTTPPDLTGYVQHVPSLQWPNYWLGCFTDPIGLPMGIDAEPDGKTNEPASGSSHCGEIPTDCMETVFSGVTFDQDECYGDLSDAGIQDDPIFGMCTMTTIDFDLYVCAGAPRIYLNILIDFNRDGDWNDVFFCPEADACADEWVVRNSLLLPQPGCNRITSPPFLIGPYTGPSWMRVTISDVQVTSDFPWRGSEPKVLFGGETEDYPVQIVLPTSAPGEPEQSTWGRMKSIYR